MSVDFKRDVKPVIDGALTIGGTIATNIEGPVGAVARLIVASLRFASDLVDRGIDPIQHIERLHACEPLLAKTEIEWSKALDEKFKPT